jgi:hypothetical protein
VSLQTTIYSLAQRGIEIQEFWKKDFVDFASDVVSEIGEPPVGALFSRIDNDSGYRQGNIRWSSRLEANRARRTVVMSTEKADPHE